MDSSKRSPQDATRAPRPRDAGGEAVSWSRRLGEAREARARVLAERQGSGATAARNGATAAAAVGPATVETAPPTAEPEKREVHRKASLRWRIVGGFAAGTAAGALAVALFLAGPNEPTATAEVAGPAAGAPVGQVPEAPAGGPGTAPPVAGVAAPSAAPLAFPAAEAAADPEPTGVASPSMPPAASATPPAPAGVPAQASETAAPRPPLPAPVPTPPGRESAVADPGHAQLGPSASDRAREAGRRASAAAMAAGGAVAPMPQVEAQEARIDATRDAAPDPAGRAASISASTTPPEVAGLVEPAEVPVTEPHVVPTGDAAAPDGQIEDANRSEAAGSIQEAVPATVAAEPPPVAGPVAAAATVPDAEQSGRADAGQAGPQATAVSEAQAASAAEPQDQLSSGSPAIPVPEVAPDTTAEMQTAQARTDVLPAVDAAAAPRQAPADPGLAGIAAAPAGPATAEAADPAAQAQARWVLQVHAPPGVSPEALGAAVDSLAAAGWRVGDVVRVDFRISRTNVRYFHPPDAETAGRVAGELGGIARDFTTYRPRPEPGTIEVWLEG